MSLTKLTKDLSIISKLSDEPNDTDGLTADELKAKFDEAGNSIKDYLNNTMTSELDAAIEDIDSDIEAIGEAVQESYKKPDGGIPKTDLDSNVQTSLGKADTALQAGALPTGGTDGDVLVKSGATDYAATWTNTPKLMGNLATIEPTSTVSKPDGYQPGEYLVYNGQLYKVGGTAIGQGETLNPGQGGNIEATTMSQEINKPWVRLINDVTTADANYDKTFTVTIPAGTREVMCTLQRASNGRTFGTTILPYEQFSGGAAYVNGSFVIYDSVMKNNANIWINAVFLHATSNTVEIACGAPAESLRVRLFVR